MLHLANTQDPAWDIHLVLFGKFTMSCLAQTQRPVWARQILLFGNDKSCLGVMHPPVCERQRLPAHARGLDGTGLYHARVTTLKKLHIVYSIM